MTRLVRSVRNHKIALLLGTGAGALIVFQHKCIMEALEIIEKNGLKDQIK